jgi:hypothetical protein
MPYVQNSATPESVDQAWLKMMREGGGIKDLADSVAELLGADMPAVKRKRAAGKYTNAPGISQASAGVDESEPLSQAQMSGPKNTQYDAVARQMQQNNMADEWAIQGGPLAQERNIPPNYLQRDQWSGKVVRGAGYSVPRNNPISKQLEIRHKTDMGGNMYGSTTPYYA